MNPSAYRSAIDVGEYLSFLDITIFFFILGLSGLAAYLGHHRPKKGAGEKESVVDFLLMGRQLTLPLFVATLVATWYGGIMPITELAFREGIFNFITQGVFWYFTYIIFAFFIVDRIRKQKPLTLPHLASKIMGKRSAKLVACFNFADVLPIAYVLSLGHFLNIIFGGSVFMWVCIGTLVVMSYAIFGGFRGVVYSDFIQFICMFSGVAMVLGFSIFSFGGLDFLRASLPETHFSLTGSFGLSETILWGLIALGTLVNPGFHQRCYAAKSDKVAKSGILLSTLIWICFDICTTFGAMYARALIPDADPNSAFMTYALQLLPMGLRGFFLAAILATILSTLDSFLFIAGTTLSHDLSPSKWTPASAGKTAGKHWGIISAGILSVSAAYFFTDSIFSVWRLISSFNAAAILLPLLVSIRHPNLLKDNQFFTGIVATSMAMIVWKLLEHIPATVEFSHQIDSFYVGLFTSFLFLSGFLLSNWLKTRSLLKHQELSRASTQ